MPDTVLEILSQHVMNEFIFPEMDIESSNNLSLSCKTFNKMYNNFYKEDSAFKLGSVTLRNCQNYIRKIMSEPKARVYFQAPMSYGKTIAGLAAPMRNWKPSSDRDGDIWIAFMPGNAIDVWLKEAIKIFGKEVYKSSSAESAVLVPGKSTVHMRAAKTQYNLKNRIVLCTTGNIKYNPLPSDEGNFNLIFDECHKLADGFSRVISKSESVLLLSASGFPKSLSESKSSYREIVVPEQCVTSKVPKTRFHYTEISGNLLHPPNFDPQTKRFNRVAFTAAGERVGQAVFDMIKDLLEKHFDDTITVWCGGDAIDFVAKRLSDEYGKNKPVFKFKSSTVRIKDMENSGNGILVAGQAASEAININCRVMIILESDKGINKERRNQLIGRCIRTTNKTKFVDIYHFVTNVTGKFKCMHSDAYFEERKRMNQKPVNPHYMLSRFQIIAMVDPEFKKVTTADIVAIVGDGEQLPKNPKKLLTWWEGEKSAFSSKMKRKLLFLPHLEIPE